MQLSIDVSRNLQLETVIFFRTDFTIQISLLKDLRSIFKNNCQLMRLKISINKFTDVILSSKHVNFVFKINCYFHYYQACILMF